jgi:hypothetical protein
MNKIQGFLDFSPAQTEKKLKGEHFEAQKHTF